MTETTTTTVIKYYCTIHHSGYYSIHRGLVPGAPTDIKVHRCSSPLRSTLCDYRFHIHGYGELRNHRNGGLTVLEMCEALC